jgi:hypothetical protein
MMSDITDRIADAIHKSFADTHNAIPGGQLPSWARDAAAAVVEGLGLREVEIYGVLDGDSALCIGSVDKVHRYIQYVSRWFPDA